MDQQKVLFADLYRLLNSIKGETKTAAKMIDTLMFNDDEWEHLSITVNGIITQAELIKAMCKAIVDNADNFLQNGPYANEGAHVTPLEGWANEHESD